MNAEKPRVLFPKDEPTLWVDVRSGRAIDHTGRIGPIPAGPRRKSPNLTDCLDAAGRGLYQRIVFVGPVPPPREGIRHWLYVETPGWKPLHLWRNPSAGRFTPENPEGDEDTNPKRFAIEVRTSAEWFGALDLNPAQARDAWQTLWNTITQLSPGSRELGLMRSPAATGTNLWAASLPRDLKLTPTPQDIREELHYTSGQHHIDQFVQGSECDCGDCRPLVSPTQAGKIPGFYYVDGRFMYSSVCRELGIAGKRMTGEECRQLLFFSEKGRYARARYRVTARVPDDWPTLGLLPAKKDGTRDWHYPNRPGAVFETWIDGSEADLALSAGWELTPHEGVLFTKARVMDTFAERITKGRAAVEGNADLDPIVKRAVTGALRQILISGIGNLASRGRPVEKRADTLREVPEEYRHEAMQHGKHFVWEEPAERNTVAGNNWYWPELSVQVWGRARARVLSTPAANKFKGGALNVPPDTLIGINGDAIYTTELPAWALPESIGGGDDGKPGRLRVQGGLPRPQNAPLDRDALNRLRERAEREGTDHLTRGTR